MIKNSKIQFKTIFTLLSFSLLFITSTLFTSCEQSLASNSQVDVETKIPELLQRNDKIRLGKEWDQVQNFYADQKTALRANSHDNEAKLNLASMFVKEARVTGEHGHYYPSALLMVDEILSTEDLDQDLRFRALMTKAGVKLSLHEFSQAKEVAVEAVKLNPRNAQIYGVLVDCHVELGEYEEAVKMADRMISIKPDIRSYSRVSYLREIHGDVDGAMSAMKMAIESGYPGTEETAWAMQTLGEMYQLYGKPEAARKIFKTILASREDYPFAVGALAQLEFDNGNIQEAKKVVQEAIDIIPEVGFYIQLAEIYKTEGKDLEFKETIDEVFFMLQDDVDHGHNMNLEYAQLYLELLEDSDKALKYALIEYGKRPNNIDVNRLLSKIYKVKGELKASKEFKLVAMKTKSAHPQLQVL